MASWPFSYHDFCTLFKRYLVLLLCLLLHLQVKISYLEMSLYEKLKGIKITNERLILIRYQARKLLTCPMLRGEDVLPLLLATFIFEVLCQKHVTSTVLQAKPITFIDGLNIMPDDEILGYECGIKALGKNVASNIRSVLVWKTINCCVILDQSNLLHGSLDPSKFTSTSTKLINSYFPNAPFLSEDRGRLHWEQMS